MQQFLTNFIVEGEGPWIEPTKIHQLINSSVFK